MPHRPKPRKSKTERMLVTTENVVKVPRSVFPGSDDRANLVKGMNQEDKEKAVWLITSRRDSARDQTEAIAAKMEKWDKQYDGVWQDPEVDEDTIFLPKTREQFQVVYAYILTLVSQLNPLVTMQPQVSSIWASTDEYRRAKVAEALFQFHVDDLWKLRDDVFPRWLKAFLKHTMAVWKVTYREDSFFPDLKIDVVDRSLLYIDPTARDLRTARWIIERYFLTRSEIEQRVTDGHWFLQDEMYDQVMHNTVQINDERLQRFFGDNFNNNYSIEEDELIEVWDYWQSPIKGLDDLYAVILGGENGQLVRYGRNPFPYKGLPYRAKSYDPNEFRPDGTGLAEQYRPFQEVVNTFLNLRITDVRKNIVRPVAATGRFITAQTQQDFKDGQKIVRLSDEVLEASRDPAFDIRKHFAELPIGTSTQELLVADLPFIIGQGKEGTNISDVFRGQSPPHQATLGQIQEQLTRNQGVFRPVYLQVMRGFEELAEICMEYFKSPDYFPASRIIQIIGANRYQDVIQNWHNPGGNLYVREVSADEMDVDVTINAVQAADAMASRTFLMASIERIWQAIGQIPDAYNELKDDISFARMVEIMVNTAGQDIEGLRLSPQEKQAKAQQQQQNQQQQLQMQQLILQMQEHVKTMGEIAKTQANTQSRIAIDTNKAQLQEHNQSKDTVLKHEAQMEQISHQTATTTDAQLKQLVQEAKLRKQFGQALAPQPGAQ